MILIGLVIAFLVKWEVALISILGITNGLEHFFWSNVYLVGLILCMIQGFWWSSKVIGLVVIGFRMSGINSDLSSGILRSEWEDLQNTLLGVGLNPESMDSFV